MRAEDEKTIASLLLALGVVLALFFPKISSFFEPYLLPSLFFVMVFSLLPFARLDSQELLKLHPTVLALVVWQQFILPGITIIVGRWLGLEQQLLYFILITVTSGSLFASPTLVQLMGLEEKMAVQTVIISTLAAPVSIYLIFGYAQHNGVELDFVLFGLRLLVFLIVPICIFFGIRWAVQRWSVITPDRLDGIGRWGSVLSLVVFCFALEAQVTDAIAESPALVVKYLFIAIGVAVIVGFTTRLVMAQFGLRAASTAMILASFRNVGLNFGLVGHIAGPNLAIYVGVCQIPMFFSPLLFDLIFGRTRQQRIDGAPDSLTTNTNPHSNGGSMSTRAVSKNHQDQTMGNSRGRAAALAMRLEDMSQTMQPRATAQASTDAVEYDLPPDFYSGSVAYDLNAYAQPAPAKPAPKPLPEEPQERLEEYLSNQLDVTRDDARALMERLQDEYGPDSGAQQATLRVADRKNGVMHLFTILLVCLIGVMAIWQGNKFFAPYLYDQDKIETIAQAHSEGKNFGVHDLNIDIRNLRNATIARMTETPDVVVLGASHWQEAHTSLIADKNFYNSHVHRDYYEDMLGVTEMWVSNGRLPAEMIIAIRDNLFTPVSERTDFLWLPGQPYYRRFAKRIGLKPHSRWETLPVQAWREQLSFKNLTAAAKTELLAPTKPGATSQRFFPTLDTLLPGGSILWSAEHREMFTRQRADAEALSFAALRRDDPPKIDPRGIEHMEALFGFLQANNVKVTFVHPPFNPVFWDAVQDSAYIDGLRKVEALTKRWSEKYNYPIIGSFDPSDVGCSADMFIDAEHGNAHCLGMLLKQYGGTTISIEELLGAATPLRSTL